MYTDFKLNLLQLTEIATSLKQKVLNGLTYDEQEIRCIPTFVPLNKIPENGRAIVLDFGGTNIRAAIAMLDNGKFLIEKGPVKTEIPIESSEHLNRDDFLNIQSRLISSLSPPEDLPLGYCFSYPAKSTLDGDAILLKWTKEVFVKDTVNKKVGELLKNHLKNYVTPVKCSKVVVINDTIASLLAGLSVSKSDGYIGLIVGTGNNMATLLDRKIIPKLNNLSDWTGPISINLESGNFCPPHLNQFDEQLDKNPEFSDFPNEQRLEKAVSGAYLATLMKIAHPQSTVDPKLGSKDVVRIATESTINDSNEIALAKSILERSAKLVSATLSGLITVINMSKPVRKVCITAEGSLFWGYQNYRSIVQENIDLILKELNYPDIKIEIVSTENANLIGSTIAALAH